MIGVILKRLSLGLLFWLCTASGSNPVIAVTDFQFVGIEEKLSRLFSEKLGGELSANELLNVIVHSEVRTVLTEIGLREDPCQDDSCLVQAGKVMNISHIISGKITRKNNNIAVQAEVLEVESGLNRKVRTVVCWRCTEEDLLMKMAGNLASTVSATIQGTSDLKNNRKLPQRQARKNSGELWKNPWTYVGVGALVTGSWAAYVLVLKPDKTTRPQSSVAQNQ